MPNTFFMPSKAFQFAFVLLILPIQYSLSAYYDVLPRGVRNLTYRSIKTGTIEGEFNKSGTFNAFDFSAKIDADVLSGIDPAIDSILSTLTATQRENFSFGSFRTDVKAEVEAQVLGLGVGVTKRLTVYAFVPYYQAKVRLNLERTIEGQNEINAGDSITIENLPSIDARIVQSLFVNYYGYQPLGTWTASDFGDTELGFMYLLTKRRNRGTKLTFGTVIPTGRVDNPDILQDIGFGDGQWDFFVEYGGGVSPRRWISADFWLRYTYQSPFRTDVRLPESETFNISETKENVKIKFGDQVKVMGNLTFNLGSAWSISSGALMTYKMSDKYKSSDSNANRILENSTEELTQTIISSISFSTLPFFRKKQFFLPLNFAVIGSKDVSGKNTPKIERLDFELRLFF